MTIAEQILTLHETLGKDFNYKILHTAATTENYYRIYTFKDGSSLKSGPKGYLREIDAIDELEG